MCVICTRYELDVIRNSVRKRKEMRLPKRPPIGRIEIVYCTRIRTSTRTTVQFGGALVLRVSYVQYSTVRRVLYCTRTSPRDMTLGFRRLEDAVANACKD